ncbi:hypothetical protein DW653_06560 [Phocaeicola plebeius]|uniref:Uncharacterized protein n=1 Tax=Phocaeicola plebeius TaxID=310297 RepID=A0A414REU9_9BACT|nr:hypothetical protein DW653_06560 [Phocaeicola plebeius]
MISGIIVGDGGNDIRLLKQQRVYVISGRIHISFPDNFVSFEGVVTLVQNCFGISDSSCILFVVQQSFCTQKSCCITHCSGQQVGQRFAGHDEVIYCANLFSVNVCAVIAVKLCLNQGTFQFDGVREVLVAFRIFQLVQVFLSF